MTVYKEMPPDAFDHHDTWIIAYCPDTHSFFATDQRGFYWDGEKEFDSEKSAIEYFENSLDYYWNVHRWIMKSFGQYYAINDFGLDNTETEYERKHYYDIRRKA